MGEKTSKKVFLCRKNIFLWEKKLFEGLEKVRDFLKVLFDLEIFAPKKPWLTNSAREVYSRSTRLLRPEMLLNRPLAI